MLAAAAAIAIAVAVLPRAFGSAESAPVGSEQLKILSANMAFGGAFPSDLLDLVRHQRPDLLAIQELKPEYARNLREQGILRLLPHSIISVRHRTPGLGVYSRLPIRRLSDFNLTTSRIALTLPDGAKLRIVDVHSPTPGFGGITRWRDTLEGLPSAGAGVPWLLVGDFNATLDQAALRDVIDRGYRDAGAATGNGLEFTWPAEKLLPPLITIDHVLADRPPRHRRLRRRQPPRQRPPRHPRHGLHPSRIGTASRKSSDDRNRRI